MVLLLTVRFALMCTCTPIVYGSTVIASLRNDDKRNLSGFPPFGRLMRGQFLLEPDFINLNHGSIGTYPLWVQKSLREFQDRVELRPDLWDRREAKIMLKSVRKALATLVNAEDVDDLVMVPNVTSGMNAILRSIVFAFGDGILHFSTMYGAMKKVAEYVRDRSNGAVTLIQFNVTYPISNDELVSNFAAFLENYYCGCASHYPNNTRIRIAILEHISALPATVLPIDRLIPLLRKRNISVLIDGAHAVGHIPIDLKSLDPDYYVGNCHKWLFAARGSAMLYVRKHLQGTVHPALISKEYSVPANFQEEFGYTGTMDYTQYMTVLAALEFRQAVGGEEVIRDYNHRLATTGGKLVAQYFQTSILQEEDQIGNMVDVGLPILQPDEERLTQHFLIDLILDKLNVFAVPHKHGGKFWLRFSAQIYNDLSDFITATGAFQELCNEINSNYTKLSNPGL